MLQIENLVKRNKNLFPTDDRTSTDKDLGIKSVVVLLSVGLLQLACNFEIHTFNL